MGQPAKLTRRALLEGAAAMGASSLLGPGAATAIPGRPSLSSHDVGRLIGGSSPLRAPRTFALVGLEWAAPDRPDIELRTRPEGGTWSRWVKASVRGHEPDGAQPAESRFGEPIWTGPADYV